MALGETCPPGVVGGGRFSLRVGQDAEPSLRGYPRTRCEGVEAPEVVAGVVLVRFRGEEGGARQGGANNGDSSLCSSRFDRAIPIPMPDEGYRARRQARQERRMKSGFRREEDGEMPSLMESDASDGSGDQLPAPPSRPRLVPPRPPEMSTSYQELRASYQYDDDDCSEYSVSDGGDSLSEDSMDRARPSQRRERGQARHRPDAPDCTDNGRDP
ncbi:hypothetical protein THAOC_26118, partial [Thalassiosira oceanica]